MSQTDIETLTNEINQFVAWQNVGCASPPPDFVKKRSLLRHLSKLNPAETVFIETGTFHGTTSRMVANHGYKVVTIELSEHLHKAAVQSLGPLGVTCLQGDSGTVLPKALDDVPAGHSVFLWLDGHYSGGETANGESETPIVQELLAVERLLVKSRKPLIVMVDDIRIFGTGDYPEMDHLVDFCRKNMLYWTIQLDSFIFSNRKKLIS